MYNQIKINSLDAIFASRYKKNASSEDDTLITFFLYLDANNNSKELFFILLYIPSNSCGSNEPSALNIEKYFVLTFCIPSIIASP